MCKQTAVPLQWLKPGLVVLHAQENALECLTNVHGALCGNCSVATMTTRPKGYIIHSVDWGPSRLNGSHLQRRLNAGYEVHCRHVSHQNSQVQSTFEKANVIIIVAFSIPKNQNCGYSPLYTLSLVGKHAGEYDLQCVRSVPGGFCTTAALLP